MESMIWKKKSRQKEELNLKKNKTMKKLSSNNLPRPLQTPTFSIQINQEESSTSWVKRKSKKRKTGKI
jgi:hypothetical protein